MNDPDIIDVEPIPDEQVTPTFYWLVRCTIVLSPKKGSRTQLSQMVNLLLDTPTPNIGRHVLGQINQLAGENAIQRHGVKPQDIADVLIDNICSLGCMTLAQFEQIPPVVMEDTPPAH